MARPINYSKWDHIEISDDSDDTHPNVDTPSLFKWRHEARLKREDEERQEKAKKNAEEKLRIAEMAKLKEQIAALEAKADKDAAEMSKLEGLKSKQAEIEMAQDDFQAKEAELEAYQKAHPKWNVDNMSEDKHNRTIINSGPSKKAGNTLDLNEYFKEHGKEVKEWGMLAKYPESHAYLKARMYLVCDHLASFLVVWAVDLQVEGKTELMRRVAHQSIVAQYILELAKTLKRDPRACVDAFFSRIDTAEKQYIDAFQDEYKSLIARVEKRAVDRLKEAEAEVAAEEAKEREARLGPAGLDPYEVIKEIPAKMREAFETQNTPLLKESFAELPDDEAAEVYRKVVGSGLWCPAAEPEEAADADAGASAPPADGADDAAAP